jgi:chromosome segregation ATPase
MVRVEYHCVLNLALNSILFLLVLSTLSTSIFSFNSYKVTLGTILHKITYEDFPADVEISFSKFQKSACRKSSNPDVLTLCSNILSLETSGFIYTIGAYLTFLSILVSIVGLSLTLFKKKVEKSKLEISQYVTPAVYWIFVLVYFILSGSESMVSPTDENVSVTFEKGAFYMFCAGGLSLCIFAHFWIFKNFSDYEELVGEGDDLFVEAFWNNLEKNQIEQGKSKDGEISKLQHLVGEQENELKAKMREIAELALKVEEMEKREENSEDGSVKISAKKKVKLRAGKKEDVEALKQELGRLRNVYATEKHQLEEEIEKLRENDKTEYYLQLSNELCEKIEELRAKLVDKEGAEEENIELGKTLKDIQYEMDGFKKQNQREKTEREHEKRQLHKVIEELKSDLDKKKNLLSQQANIDILKSDNERLSEELVRTEMAKKHLSEKLVEMSEKVGKLEKDLLLASEHKHNLEVSSLEIDQLKNMLQSKREALEKASKVQLALNESLSEKENRIEELSNIQKFTEKKVKDLNEHLENLNLDLKTKEKDSKKAQKDFLDKLKAKEEEVNLLNSQIHDLEKEIQVVKKAAHSEKSEEYANLKEEAEILENKVSSLNNMIKKYRDDKSKLEVDLEAALSSNQLLENRFDQLKETNETQRLTIEDLESQLKSFEDLKKSHETAQALIHSQKSEIESLKNEVQQLKEALRALEMMKKDKDYYERQFQDSLKDVEALNSALRKLEVENTMLTNLQDENLAFREQVATLNSSIEEANKRSKDLRDKLRTIESDFEKEKEDLQYNLSKARKENQNLEKILKNKEDYLSNELEAVQRDKENLQDNFNKLKSENAVFKQEIDRLDNLQKYFRNLSETAAVEAQAEGLNLRLDFDEQRKLHNAQIEHMKKTLTEASKSLQAITEEKEKLRSELAASQNELQQVSEELAGLQNQVFQDRRASGSPEYNENLLFSPLSNRSMESSARSTQDLVIIESVAPAYSNAILDNVSKLKKEPPMTYKNVWKLFEDIMADKCKMDRLELAMGRQPRTMTEYMLDFVYLQYGLKTLALRQLKSLIASLEVLYKQGHPYGTLFCRFLGLFHPRPLSFQISIYLLIVQEKFVECAAKVKEKKPSSFSQAYDIMQYGGQASIIDLLDLIQKICRNNRECGERIITAMHKDQIDRVEISILKICGCMARMGKTSDYIFEILNAERRGPGLEYHEFIDGVRYTLNIWVTQEEAEDLCRFIDQDDTGYITFDSWYQKVNFVEFAEKMYSKVAMVSKSDFLNALVDEYEREIVDDYRILKGLIKLPVLNQNNFAGFLAQLDPSLDEEDIMKLYDEAREQDAQGMAGVSPHSVCVVVLKHNIGGYGLGIFDVYDLDLDQPKTSTEGVRNELVVERNMSGRLEIDIRRRNK